MRAVEPEGWLRGPGFTHAFASEGEDVVVFSGVIGNDPASGAMVEGGMVEQVAQAVRNVAAVVAAAGSEPRRVMFVRIYVTDRQAYMQNLREIGQAFREVFGGHYPAMTFLAVSGLFVPSALVEIDGVAALPRAG
jgi:enamine deaminase RidA (YjgF/YER057c/UK114 family)